MAEFRLAGAVDHDRGLQRRQVRCVRRETDGVRQIDFHGRAELPHEFALCISLHRRDGSLDEDLAVELGYACLQPGEHAFHVVADGIVALAGKCADIDAQNASVGHDVHRFAAVDGVDAHGASAEQRVRFELDLISFELIEHPFHRHDGVDAPLRHGTVDRLAPRGDPDPEQAAMGGNDGKVRRLGNDDAGKGGLPRSILHEPQDAGAVGLLARRGREKDISLQRCLRIDHLADCGDGGSDSPFHVRGTAAVDPAVLLHRAKRRVLPRLLAGADDVEMTGEKQGGALPAGLDMGDDIGPAAVPLVHLAIDAVLAESGGDDLGGGGFPLARRRIGLNQLFQQVFHGGCLNGDGLVVVRWLCSISRTRTPVRSPSARPSRDGRPGCSVWRRSGPWPVPSSGREYCH